ncbi:Ricin B lectin domain and Glycosyltransferase 2-like domain-containing protein [Strongyloides ratti]|uniref:Polypeptide N-acetylgalactosaminyltransferase n=1 Tax=Strongyloides ratti TaxID=34506 RepID=A0A090LD23_STRRB|nr:Ricin B lectin domain and Glycosyltransferase 2-like domain-containing protein [Strongyloides ratti]CEF67671.1 Ricin B lectin domain and Glycosyltransferase 2-like domain-containing protein [Strongyloides ratti]
MNATENIKKSKNDKIIGNIYEKNDKKDYTPSINNKLNVDQFKSLNEKNKFTIKYEKNFVDKPITTISNTITDDKITNKNEEVISSLQKTNDKSLNEESINKFDLNKERTVNLSDLIIIKNEDERLEYNKGIENYQFNALVSRKIGYRRKILDSRNDQCRDIKYSSDLDPASIIICYFNEEPYVLIRMVNSILDRTADHLIHEILLVDDSSNLVDRHPEIITKYKEKYWPDKVKMLKTQKNEGLIRAKIFGAHQATGKNLVFLDSHCEVNEKWLDPLLERIKIDPKKVVCPIIDIIKHENLEYVTSPICMGGFTWSLIFKWDYPDNNYLNNRENLIKPLKSPTMAGGLFAISKETFTKIGEYDSGMDIWGAENVEMSFRIWMCGYEIEIIPCSRVGHIFRDKRPYGTNIDSMAKNSLRAALIWMDEYKEEFFKAKPYLKIMDESQYGDISKMVKLRQDLQCKSFDWYLKNIYPRLYPGNIFNETEIRLSKIMWENEKKFQIKFENNNLCLSAESLPSGRVGVKAKLFLESCNSKLRQQIWRITKKGELRNMASSNLCLDTYNGVSLLKCHNQGLSQEWLNIKNKIYTISSKKCLFVDKNESQYASIDYCSKSNNWKLEYI